MNVQQPTTRWHVVTEICNVTMILLYKHSKNTVFSIIFSILQVCDNVQPVTRIGQMWSKKISFTSSHQFSKLQRILFHNGMYTEMLKVLLWCHCFQNDVIWRKSKTREISASTKLLHTQSQLSQTNCTWLCASHAHFSYDIAKNG